MQRKFLKDQNLIYYVPFTLLLFFTKYNVIHFALKITWGEFNRAFYVKE